MVKVGKVVSGLWCFNIFLVLNFFEIATHPLIRPVAMLQWMFFLILVPQHFHSGDAQEYFQEVWV